MENKELKEFKEILHEVTDTETAQENSDFPALFLPRVGFGAGFSKNAENQHTGQNACFDDKNSQKQRKRLEIIRFPALIIWWR